MVVAVACRHCCGALGALAPATSRKAIPDYATALQKCVIGQKNVGYDVTYKMISRANPPDRDPARRTGN